MRSAPLGPTVILRRFDQSGSTAVSPEVARGVKTTGRSAACELAANMAIPITILEVMEATIHIKRHFLLWSTMHEQYREQRCPGNEKGAITISADSLEPPFIDIQQSDGGNCTR